MKDLTAIRQEIGGFGPVYGNSMQLAMKDWLALKVVDLCGKASYGLSVVMD